MQIEFKTDGGNDIELPTGIDHWRREEFLCSVKGEKISSSET